jgi:pimeloyl-ACP methyl ester carboxylesterase
MHTRSFEVNGLRLEAIAAGPPAGPLVFLLHGFPESADAWGRQLPALAGAGLHVLALHQRGYAGSDKPAGVLPYRLPALAADVLAVADALQVPRFSVVGHDWGAAVAWHLTAAAPDRLDKVVVMNGPHPGTVGAHAMRHPSQFLRSWYIGAFQVPLLPEMLLRANGHALLRRTLEGSARPGAFDPGLLDRYQVQWAQPGSLSAMLAWYRALAVSTPTPARRVDVPVTVVWGEDDRFLERGLADAALALCRQGRLVAVPGATHWLHHEEPGRVNSALLEALA